MANGDVRKERRLARTACRLQQHGTNRAVQIRFRRHRVSGVVHHRAAEAKECAELRGERVERLKAEAVQVLPFGDFHQKSRKREAGENAVVVRKMIERDPFGGTAQFFQVLSPHGGDPRGSERTRLTASIGSIWIPKRSSISASLTIVDQKKSMRWPIWPIRMSSQS